MSKIYYQNIPNYSISNSFTNNILKTNDATKFHKSLKDYKATPLIHLPNLSKKHNVGTIYVKDESYRFGLNAFKVLGASYAIKLCLEKNPSIETVCTATDGNHGRAVAWAAKKFKKNAVVFVPRDTTLKRINVIEQEGAKVIQVDGNYDNACQEAENASNTNNWTLIQDTAWEGYEEIPAMIMAGYLTLFKELENSIHTASKPKIDIVFLQAGVGSMAASGIYYYLNKYGANKPKIVIVEPQEADGILLSFFNNKISTSKGNSSTIMAGLNCGTPSLGAWSLLKNGADVSIKISDDYAKKAMRELYYPTADDKRIISGESGAGGFAGFLTIMNDGGYKAVKESLDINNNSNILFINTEGDTDKQIFEKIINNTNKS